MKKALAAQATLRMEGKKSAEAFRGC